jgi:hypothetical protein
MTPGHKHEKYCWLMTALMSERSFGTLWKNQVIKYGKPPVD